MDVPRSAGRWLAALGLALGPLATRRVAAQSTPVRKVDLATRSFDSIPPFDRVMLLRVELPDGVRTVLLSSGPAIVDRNGTRFVGDSTIDSVTVSGLVTGKTAVFHAPPMTPNVEYLYRFTLRTADSSTRVNVLATAEADARTHFDTDVGVLWSPRPGPAYLGAGSNLHFYFLPINKDENPANYGSLREQLLKRLSVFAGLSLIKFQSGEPVEHRYSVGTVVAGVGIRPQFPGSLRPYNVLRFNVGLLFFQQDDANPLVDEKRLKHAPFVSTAVDIALKDVLGPIATLIGVNK